MALESLMERRGTFDYILLETTGLADPGNIAPVFWMDEGLGSSIYLDGIVTLVDAKNILHLLDEPTTEEKASSHSEDHDHGSGPVLSMAHLQVSHADVIILNKVDLVTPEELEVVRDRISAINSVAKIHVTDHSRTPQIEGVVLDLHAYDHLDDLDFSKKGHSHIDPVCLFSSSCHSPGANVLTRDGRRFQPLQSWYPLFRRTRYLKSTPGYNLFCGNPRYLCRPIHHVMHTRRVLIFIASRVSYGLKMDRVGSFKRFGMFLRSEMPSLLKVMRTSRLLFSARLY